MHSSLKAGVLITMAVLATFASAQFASMSSAVPANIGFIDISTTGGTAITGVFDDTQHDIVTTVGNALFPAGRVQLCANGVAIAGLPAGNTDFLAFTNTNFNTGFNTPPVLAVPFPAQAVVFPYWDDLHEVDGREDTTIYWQEVAGVLYIMWKNTSHCCPAVPGEEITFEVQVFSNPPSCGPSIQYLYPDTVFGGSFATSDNAASATIGYWGFGPLNPIGLKWSFNGAGAAMSGDVLSVILQAAALVPSSPFGAGSLRLQYGNSTCTSPFDSYVLAATMTHGRFPSGWLYGVDIPLTELFSEMSIGAPFVGSGPAFDIGPFSGLPPITIYAVVLCFDLTGTLFGHSNAIEYTIP